MGQVSHPSILMGSSSPTTPPPLLQSLLPPHPPKTSPNTLKTFNAPPHLIRRSLLLLLSSTSLTLPLPLPLPLPSPPALALPDPPPTPPPPPPPPPDTTITDRVFLDLSLCPSYFRSDRTLGDICPEIQPLGRLVLGLYGKLLPRTVANFKSMCTGSAGSTYRGTLVHKIIPGSYFMAGKQGRRDKGEVRPPLDLATNIETVDSRSFALKHLRPGTLSLCLSENDDEEEIKLDPGYRNVEFLITTGPAPCPQLDNRNIVFGAVLEGLDVVTTIATIPTYKPGERIRQFNDLAEFLGDERAQNARTIWNRPLKTIYISDCGELKVAKPSLTPTLP